MHPLFVHAWVVAQATAAQATTPVAPAQGSVSFGDAIALSMTAAFATLFAVIPRLLGFLVIVGVGWLLAGLLAKGTRALLEALRFDEIARRTGVADFIEQMNSETDASAVVATAVKWTVRLVVLLVAFSALGLPAVGDVLRQFVLWLPNLLVALVVLVLGGLAARAVGNIVRGTTSEAGFDNPDMLATVARVVVWGFALVVAVNQIGIASTLINTLFMGIVGAAALAAGLAFGLGGRDMAARTLERWSGRLEQARPTLRQARARGGERLREQARIAADEARRVASSPHPEPGYREPRAD